MGGDQHLKTLAPDLAGQCHADFVALLRSNLPSEALVGVERHLHAVCLPKRSCTARISSHMVCPAMDAGDKLGALVQLGFGIVLCVVQCLGKGHRIRFCPGWPHSQDALQTVLDRPDLSYRQCKSLKRSAQVPISAHVAGVQPSAISSSLSNTLKHSLGGCLPGSYPSARWRKYAESDKPHFFSQHRPPFSFR